MAEPSQEDLEQFLQLAVIFTGASPDPVIASRFIKDANYDLNNAINNYEQNPNRYAAEKYDEALFSQDRDGGSNQYAGIPSFQIDRADDPQGQYPNSTAATRPNTPSNSIHDSAMGDSQTLGANRSYQNPQWGQESGVIGSSGVQFGPANRDSYETSQWALTTVVHTVPDPVASQRKREPGEPAFMKPLPSQDYLPSLITILNNIPLAHNALLLKEHVLPNYGQEPQWWQGASITLSQTIDLDNQQQPDQRLDIVYEAQRLMAFLDYTERSYGSAEALSKVDYFQNIELSSNGQYDGDVVKFLEAWKAAVTRLDPEAGFEKLFESTAEQVQSGDTSRQTFSCLVPSLENGAKGPTVSLYDVLDENLWGNDPDGTRDIHASIESMAEIFVIIVKQPDMAATGLNMAIPASFYADRYLTEHEPKAKQMRKERAGYKKKIARIQEKYQKLARFNYNGKAGDALSLLQVAMDAFKPHENPLNHFESEEDLQKKEEQEVRDQKTFEELERIYEVLEKKLKELKSREVEAQNAYEQLSNLLKEPTNSEETSPKLKYHLCGISTDPAVTYIKSQSNSSDDEAIDMDTSEQERSAQEWWRIQYENTPNISKSHFSEADVLAAATMENREVLLVYASDQALQQSFEDVPQALAEFVSEDNMLFREELALDEQPPAYRTLPDEGTAGVSFEDASMREWLAAGQEKQPEMEEKGSGLVAEMTSGNGGTTRLDSDMDMKDAEAAQHIEFAEHS